MTTNALTAIKSRLQQPSLTPHETALVKARAAQLESCLSQIDRFDYRCATFLRGYKHCIDGSLGNTRDQLADLSPGQAAFLYALSRQAEVFHDHSEIEQEDDGNQHPRIRSA